MTAIRPQTQAASTVSLLQPSPWLRTPAWDGLWMLSALWLAPIIFGLSRGYADPRESPLDVFYCVVSALFWIGHRLCSTYLAYCTEAYRPLLRTQPARFILVPAMVTLACFAVFLPADEALPWSRDQRLVALAIVDYAFVTYHFAAQHFGVLSLYRVRVGRGACVSTRTADRLFALGVGGVLVFVADVLAGAVAYQDQWLDRWPIATWLVSAEGDVRAGAMLLLLVTALAMLVFEAHAPRWSWPRVLYVLGVVSMVAIAFSPRSPFLFLVIWTSQHWILATGLASQTPTAEPRPEHGVVRRLLHALNTRPWAVLLLLVTASIALLPLFEVEANRDGGTYYGDRIFGSLATGLRTSSWVPALVALGFATGFVHYLLDRRVYRLSDARVRVAARALLDR